MNKKTFIKKYHNKSIEDWGCYNSDESKQMCRDFVSMLKTELKDYQPQITIEPNHYDFGGMVCINGKYVYVSYSIPRYGEPIKIESRDPLYGILYRTAQHEKDWKGGMNNFTNFDGICEGILKLAQAI